MRRYIQQEPNDTFAALYPILIFVFMVLSITGNAQAPDQYSGPTDLYPAEHAPDWTELLLNTQGWLGADGIYSIPLDGNESQGRAKSGKTLLIFSDSIIGDVQNDSLKNGDWGLVHNTVAYLTPGEKNVPDIDFHYKTDEKGDPESLFEPETKNADPDDIYWLGDGFVNQARGDSIYIFSYRIESLEEGIYPFRIAGVSLIKIANDAEPPFEDQIQFETPLFSSSENDNLTFGASVFVNTEAAGAPDPDGYIYVYGVKGVEKSLVAARVRPERFEDFDSWKFWNGSSWSEDIGEVAGIISNVSNEMSISYLEGGNIVATYQLGTNSPDIVIQVGKSPVGPFHPYKKIWSTPEIFRDIDFYTYNAKAHPHLSKLGELLISYNVNSFDFIEDIMEHPNHVRPRFIRFQIND